MDVFELKPINKITAVLFHKGIEYSICLNTGNKISIKIS